MIRIENFPLFVTSKAEFESERINAYGTEWFIHIQLYKYCRTSKEYILVNSSSSNKPETLSAFLCGRRSDRKKCSFDVDKTFMFKQESADRENWGSISHKFGFDSTNYYAAWGYYDIARIDVILFYQFLTLIINFRIFWTSEKAIWLITHLKCSLMSPFQSANRFITQCQVNAEYWIDRYKQIWK